ncbi:hypothetical protein KIW84_045121 [Lathyrus oleraceus]|uniref:GH16 domain-containing protein n=1 Tax=Pisum sativum TaxID=3888 RepID=A0A9D4XJL8_PEA|nr:hypothetical protein KIW84_045121 [Pisum sativum]
MNIKMVPIDSAGTVTAVYLSSQNAEHDKIDFEFLGNRTGRHYFLQTNVFTSGQGKQLMDDTWWKIYADPRIEERAIKCIKSRKAAYVALRLALQKAVQLRLEEKEKNKSPSYAMRISLQNNKDDEAYDRYT